MINRTVTTEGGEYIKTLERPVRATHLLCASTIEGEVTEKMKYAEKFNKAGEARIKIIWEEWLWDCLTLGGVHLFFLDQYSTSAYVLAFKAGWTRNRIGSQIPHALV